MAENPNGFDSEQSGLPAEDDGYDERAVNPSAPNLDMDRSSFLRSQDDWEEDFWQDDVADPLEDYGALGHNEVAAVSVDRSFYVSDVPSPYLSTRQAHEDINKTKHRHSVITTTITLVLVLATLGAAGWFLWQTLRSPEPQAVMQYDTATIEHGEFLNTIDTTTLVHPLEQRVVTSEVSGTVMEVFAENGMTVAEGDPLFRLENPTITEAYQKANEALDAAVADNEEKARLLDDAIAATDAAQKTADATPNNTTAQSLLEDAVRREKRAQEEFDASTAMFESIQETFDRAQEQQDRLTVRAPIAGMVSEVNRDAGVATGITGSTRLCSISDSSSYRIEVEVPLKDLNRVYEQPEVRLTFPSANGLELVSSVSHVEDVDSIHLAVVILEPDERIGLGMTVEASIILDRIPNSLLVPMEALLMDEDGNAHLDVLLDPSRGIDTDVPVEIVATNGVQAAVKADNIQAGTSVILARPLSAESAQ